MKRFTCTFACLLLACVLAKTVTKSTVVIVQNVTVTNETKPAPGPSKGVIPEESTAPPALPVSSVVQAA